MKKKKLLNLLKKDFEIDELKNIYLKAGSDWFDSGSDKIGSGFVEVVLPSEEQSVALKQSD